jgi:hypothetical protein
VAADSFNRRLERMCRRETFSIFVTQLHLRAADWTGQVLEFQGIVSVLTSDWQTAKSICSQGIPLAVSQVTNFNAFAGFGTQRPIL